MTKSVANHRSPITDHRSPLGLLGGSFDPIHCGHLQLARDALKHLRLGEVHFLPAAQPWQKGELTAAGHRAEMVRLAIEHAPRFVLDMREIERGGTTYTIDTLLELRSVAPNRSLVLIMGSDQFARRHTWRGWQQLSQLAHIAVAQRAGTQTDPAPLATSDIVQLESAAGGSVVHFRMKPTDVSATEVRRLLREPQSASNEQRLAAMVPAQVLDYIRAHHLYRNN